MDIAKYGIAIDARQVKDAEKALDGMGAAGARAEKSSNALSKSFVTMASDAAKAYGSLVLVNGVITSSVAAAKEYTAAINGLSSVARYSGENIQATLGKAAALTRDGLLSTSEAATALKNLLSRGFSTDQAVMMIERFKDSAAFGRQASLEFGQAVVSATEGIKNENSILVDNAGVTKNVSQMWKEYAATIGVGVGELAQAQKRQAEYNGVLRETEGQLGNAALASDGLVGAQARMDKALKDAATSFGQLLTPAITAAANAATMLLENGVNPTIFGMEALGVKAAETAAKVGLFFSFLGDPKRWSGGIAGWINSPEYKAQIAALEKLSDEMLTASAGRISGATGPEAPNLGKDSGARRQDAKEAAKEAKERVSDYQRLVESSRERIAVLQAELSSETKLTEGEKYAAKMLADVRSGKLKLTAAEREHLEAMAGAIGQMSKYQAQQAEQAEGVGKLADEERKRNDELRASVQHDQDALDVLKIRTDLMMRGVTATEDITVALLEAQLASKDFTAATWEEIDALDKRLAIAREAATVAGRGRRFNDEKRVAEDATRAWDDASRQIGQSLSDEIMRGGKSGADLLESYFRTLVLRPAFQGVAQGATSAIGQSLLGNAGTTAAGQFLGGNISGSLVSAGNAAGLAGLSQVGQGMNLGFSGLSSMSAMSGATPAASMYLGAALPWIGGALALGSMAGLFGDNEGDAQRSGAFRATLGGSRAEGPGGVGSSFQNTRWFSEGEMQASLNQFSVSLASTENALIKNLGLTTEQIARVNADLESVASKQYEFGMEHTDWTQSMADEQIVADRMKVVADVLGMTVEQLGVEMARTNEALRATFDASVLSDAEKLAAKTQSVRDGFSALNLSMPETVEQYRAMVEGSSGALERSLLKLAPAFVEVTRAAEQATVAQEQAAAQAREQAAQAAMGGLSAAFDQLNAAVEAERAGIAKAHAAQVESVNAQIAASDRLTRRLEPLSSALHSTLTNLREGLAGAAMSRQQAQAQISAAVAVARAGGTLPEANELQNALSVVSKPSEGLFKTFQEYQRDQYLTAIDVADLVELTDAQLTDAQRQTAAMTAQLSVLEAGFAAENARLDGILTLAQAQLNATMGNTTALLSVAAALAQFGGARVAVEAASSNPASQAVISAYQQLAGKSVGEIDAEGFDYWGQQAEQIGVEQMRADFANSVRAVRGYANGGTHLGGWRMVGEAGTELEYTGASQIVSNRDARDLLDMAPLLEEMRGLRIEMSAMRGDVAQTQRNTRRHLDLFEVTTEGGEAMRTVAA